MSQIIVISPEDLEHIVQRAVDRALASAQPRPDPDEWISVTEFLERTGKNAKTARNTVYQRCASGEIPARKAGKSWEINYTQYCK